MVKRYKKCKMYFKVWNKKCIVYEYYVKIFPSTVIRHYFINRISSVLILKANLYTFSHCVIELLVLKQL